MGAGKGNNKVRLAGHWSGELRPGTQQALITVTPQGPLAVTEELHVISFVVEYVYQGLKMKLQVSDGKRGAREAADLEEGSRRAPTEASWSGCPCPRTDADACSYKHPVLHHNSGLPPRRTLSLL